MKRMIVVTVLALFAGCSLGATEWSKDHQKAKEKAAKEDKDLIVLLLTTERDPASKNFKEVVMAAPAVKEVMSKYVVLIIDVNDQPDAIPQAELDFIGDLANSYQINNVPFIIITDSKGRSWAAGYFVNPTPESLVADMKKIEAHKAVRDAMLKRVEVQTDDANRATAMAEALDYIGRVTFLIGYEKEIAQIIEWDKDNALGLKERYHAPMLLREILDSLRGKNYEEAIKKGQDFLKTYSGIPSNTQMALYYMAYGFYAKGEIASCLEALDSAVAVDPNSQIAAQCRAIAENIRANQATDPKGSAEAQPKEESKP